MTGIGLEKIQKIILASLRRTPPIAAWERERGQRRHQHSILMIPWWRRPKGKGFTWVSHNMQELEEIWSHPGLVHTHRISMYSLYLIILLTFLLLIQFIFTILFYLWSIFTLYTLLLFTIPNKIILNKILPLLQKDVIISHLLCFLCTFRIITHIRKYVSKKIPYKYAFYTLEEFLEDLNSAKIINIFIMETFFQKRSNGNIFQ